MQITDVLLVVLCVGLAAKILFFVYCLLTIAKLSDDRMISEMYKHYEQNETDVQD